MKKIVTAFMMFVILMCLSHTLVLAESDTDYDNAIGILSQLEINKDINADAQKSITRAEFVAMVVRAINADLIGVDSLVFGDCDDSVFKSEIFTARILGITNGTSENTFSPNDGVLRDVAAKIIVSALGYTEQAEALGGYPSGYINVASRIDLFKGVGSESDLSVRDACIMVCNALFSQVSVISGVQDGNIIRQINKSSNLLTENFDLNYADGIITAAGNYSAEISFSESEKLKIGNLILNCDMDVTNLLGHSAEVWYDADERKAVVVIPTDSNRCEEIKSEDVISYSDFSLRAYNSSGKDASYSFNKSFTFILNGQPVEHSEASFLMPNSTLKLISNDGDGKYEYVVCEKADYFVIRAIDSINMILYDEHSDAKSVSLSDDDCDYQIYIDGKMSEFDDLKQDMACRVIVSDNRRICTIYASSQKSDAVINEIADDEITINGSIYKISDYFRKLSIEVNPGEKYSFLISDDNAIVAALSGIDERYVYGYFLGYNQGNGSFENARIKLLNENDEKAVYNLDDKIYLNGNPIDSKSDELKARFIIDGIPDYQIIKYRLKGSVITHLYTAADKTSDWNVDVKKESETGLNKYVDKKSVNYRSGAQFGIPNVSFRDGVIFSVPKDLATKNGIEYDDELFTVIMSSELSNNVDYTVDAYDFNQSYVPQAVVVYNGYLSGKSEAPSMTSDQYIVYGVSDALDEQGEQIKLLKVYGNSKYSKLYIKEETYNTLAGANKMPSSGDLIRIVKDRAGYVKGLALDVDYDEANESIKINYGVDNLPTTGKEYINYFSGRVLTQPDEFMLIEADNSPADCKTNGLVNLRLSSPKYVVFNMKDKSVSLADKSTVVSAVAGGSEASYVVCKSSYYSVNTIYIYTK